MRSFFILLVVGSVFVCTMVMVGSSVANTSALAGEIALQEKRDPTSIHYQGDVDDEAISEDIHQAIMSDEDLAYVAPGVEVVVMNGYVSIIGKVKNQRQSSTIEQNARAVDRVRHVDNQLTIE